MANTYLTRTPSSASNRKTWTWSGWVKRGELSASNQVLFQARDGSFPEKLQFNSAGKLEYDHDIAGTDYTVRSDMVFRDINAFYHIVVAKDTTQATETNRIKVYVNGEQQTLSEYQLGYPPQNYDGAINNNVAHHIGSNNGSEFFDGSMSHIHFIDGTAYDATAFGETDATTGEWKAKTSPSVTYGTNGFLILKDGNTITDQSSNSNAFTLSGGTLTDLKDNPDNTFATMNPLYRTTNVTFSNGNNTITSSSSSWNAPASTLAVSTGKWYVEGKATGYNHNAVGVTSNPNGGSAAYPFEIVGGYGYKFYSGGKTSMGADDVAYGNTLANGDIFQIALDLDNSKIYFGKNGTWQNSGVPTSGSTGTGSAFTLPSGETYHFVNALNSQSGGASSQWNFGNGYFGTTAITTNSGNGYSGAEGSSKFNYTVPTGYSALSTKGLNE